MTAISDDFKYLLTALAEQTGLDQLGLDENGACALQFDDRITVYLVELEKEAAIRLVSDLGTPSPDVEGAAFQRCLLEANWLGTGTHGATLSLEPETGNVCLWRQASLAALNPVSFTDLVGQFVDTAEAWTALIQGEALPNAADSASTLGHPVGIPA
ncbi:type III secretion system chaperone [Verrucomicrobium sp. BvORR034]|uniref:type III secretion system chaperone n=1 Tax=Verrucomicrobium sp. BvORR034 TaxID=1396418 RepID=UPI000679516B|nr:type III secretion system chaperone [Verrucomicrobium sp. BvORR034]